MKIDLTGTIDILSDFIRINLILGFGLYSILFFILKLFLKEKKVIIDFDHTACRVAIYSGIAYTTLWIFGLAIKYFQLIEVNEKTTYLEKVIGNYWIGFILQPLIWTVLTQLLRINFFKKSMIYRIIMTLLFVFSYEQLVIIISTLQRDYLPLNWWYFNMRPADLIAGFIFSIMIFILTISIIQFGKNKIKTLYNIS